jgi:hypothetical protein
MTTDRRLGGLNDCDCGFDFQEPDGEESWHYKRTCGLCGFEWGALHCPHDGAQNPCPDCGWIDPGKRTPGQILGCPQEDNDL